ncbi:hypothetical protein GQX74_012524 [Glossina fuscipes]|nr:hypothetical protein GQX74_012524 [Glossina fuscipes]
MERTWLLHPVPAPPATIFLVFELSFLYRLLLLVTKKGKQEKFLGQGHYDVKVSVMSKPARCDRLLRFLRLTKGVACFRNNKSKCIPHVHESYRKGVYWIKLDKEKVLNRLAGLKTINSFRMTAIANLP